VTRTPPHVAILLSVFHGDRFIDAQLESCAAQVDVRWSLTWRDDGGPAGRSCQSALLRLGERFPGQVHAVDGCAGHLGVAPSYFALLAAAPAAAFYAFADQDDVWLPGKLHRAVTLLSAAPDDRPALYCSRQSLVDANLRPIGASPVPRRPLGFGNALVQNVATGCTMVLNPKARDAVLAMPPPPGTVHDWWCYLVVAGVGGRLVFDPEPSILYRQHDHNAVGALDGAMVRALGALRRGPGPFTERLDLHLYQLNEFRDRLTPANRALLDALIAARGAPWWRRCATILSTGIYRQGSAEDLALRIWLTLGRRRKS
jgi:hypothetical protein